MKEPTAEDLSYLSDSNIEFCLDYYMREYKRRDVKKARAWVNLARAFVWTPGDESPRFPSVHRQSA